MNKRWWQWECVRDYRCIKCQFLKRWMCCETPSLLQTISSVTPAWMHWNGLTYPAEHIHTLWLIRNSGPWPTWVNKGAGETMTSNYLSARPQLHPDTQGAHPSRRDKDRAPLRQTAAGPYGGVCTQSLGLPLHTHTCISFTYTLHTVYACACTNCIQYKHVHVHRYLTQV